MQSGKKEFERGNDHLLFIQKILAAEINRMIKRMNRFYLSPANEFLSYIAAR
jgi:hypothetical protein